MTATRTRSTGRARTGTAGGGRRPPARSSRPGRGTGRGRRRAPSWDVRLRAAAGAVLRPVGAALDRHRRDLWAVGLFALALVS
ncbi:MAG TPA: hypothetical protein VFH45_09510, partial [Acidimicrobiales bacterium]|nr:hypothetical protein [Acidimicrobiales bacterium]